MTGCGVDPHKLPLNYERYSALKAAHYPLITGPTAIVVADARWPNS